MASNKDNYLTQYRIFFEHFAPSAEKYEQLPVKLASYKIRKDEITGVIIDWTIQYLRQTTCPPTLVAPLTKLVVEEVKQLCQKCPDSCGFLSSVNAYEPLKLMQTVIVNLKTVCLRYLDNSELDSLPIPNSTQLPYYPPVVRTSAMKNTRRTMEDRLVYIDDLNTVFNIEDSDPISYYGVFDGHGGQDAVSYTAAHLHQYIVENIYYPTNPERALREAFVYTDATFADKAKKSKLQGGTTAVCALYNPKQAKIHLAWVGDSSAILISKNETQLLVEPHLASRWDEKERIEQMGGYVTDVLGAWRVQGKLIISRAIGDVSCKPYISADPEVRTISLKGDEDFLLLYTDGFSDAIRSDKVADIIYNELYDHPESAENISKLLVHLAKKQGSVDNISVIVVFLKDPRLITAEPRPLCDNLTERMEEAKIGKQLQLDNHNSYFCEDDYKKNGTKIFEENNGKRAGSEFDNEDDRSDDYGPETDVDAVDDVLLSPSIAAAKALAEGIVVNNNNPFDNDDEDDDDDDDDDEDENGLKDQDSDGENADGVHYGMMQTVDARGDNYEVDVELQRQQTHEFDLPDAGRNTREETPTPPVDSVLDNSGCVAQDNVGESGGEESQSDDEDEWNYIRGDKNHTVEIPQQTAEPVDQFNFEIENHKEEIDMASQLNPDAAEFVPVSPVHGGPTNADELICPPKPESINMDQAVPSPVDFMSEISQRPGNVDEDDICDISSDNHMEGHSNTHQTFKNILNSKSLEEIEFDPKHVPHDLNESEILSTKAEYGDDTIGVSKNESTFNDDETDFKADFNGDFKPQNQDPMSMSFYQDKDVEPNEFNRNPFDLNAVQMLPDDVDEFVKEDETVANGIEASAESNYQNHEEVTDSDLLNAVHEIHSAVQDAVKGMCEEEKEQESPIVENNDLVSLISQQENENPFMDYSKSPEPNNDAVLQDQISNLMDEPSPVHAVADECMMASRTLEPDIVSEHPQFEFVSDNQILETTSEMEEKFAQEVKEKLDNLHLSEPMFHHEEVESENIVSPVEDFVPHVESEHEEKPSEVELPPVESTQEHHEEMFDYDVQQTSNVDVSSPIDEAPILNFEKEDVGSPIETIPAESYEQQFHTEEVTFTSNIPDNVSSVAPDINSFLSRSLIPEAPVSPVHSELDHSTPIETEHAQTLTNGFQSETPPPTPSVAIDEPLANVDESNKLIEAVEKLTESSVNTETIVAAAAATAVVAATAAAVATKTTKTAAKPAPAKKILPTKAPASPIKSPALKKAPATSAPKPTAFIKPTGKTSTSTVTTTKTTTLKSPRPKPATTTGTTKPIADKKPLTNGEAKPAPKPAPIRRPLASSTSTTSTTTSSKTTVSKTTTSKVSPTTPTKPLVSARTTTVKTTTTTTSAAPKPRPTTLAPKTNGIAPKPTGVKTSAPLTTARPAPKVSSTVGSPKPKSTLSSTLAPRPRTAPTATKTSTATKPPTDKQVKETANKQLSTSTRTNNITKTTTKTSTTSSLSKRNEYKPPPLVKSTKTSTTTVTKASAGTKKPTPITRTTITKTTNISSPTAVAPHQNGTVTLVQEISSVTIINDDLLQPMKDVSPVSNEPIATLPHIDNALVVDNELIN